MCLLLNISPLDILDHIKKNIVDIININKINYPESFSWSVNQQMFDDIIYLTALNKTLLCVSCWCSGKSTRLSVLETGVQVSRVITFKTYG